VKSGKPCTKIAIISIVVLYILGTVKIKRLHDILDSKTARQFLTTSVRTRRTVIRDNATEECCKEGCTYKEISEYKC